jgi:hypothetical protein
VDVVTTEKTQMCKLSKKSFLEARIFFGWKKMALVTVQETLYITPR